MRIRVLGARQGESKRSHFTSLLVDRVLALDAGNLTSALTIEEQAAVRHVLLTHRHYDHVKDLATLGFNLAGRGQVDIYCTPEVRAALEATILSGEIWLNFFALPTPEKPTFVHIPVQPNETFSVAGYTVRTVGATHSVPALSYAVTSPKGGTVLYSGDSGPGSGATWASTKPDLLVVEVTYPDDRASSALKYGHLSPKLLAHELRAFGEVCGKLPKVAVVHVNPYYEAEISAEVAALARSLPADIWLPKEGATIAVGAGTSAHRRAGAST